MIEDIFGLPRQVKGVGNVYPVLMLDFIDFQQFSWIFQYSKKHVNIPEKSNISTLESIIYREFNCEILDNIEGLKGNELVKFKIEVLCEAMKFVVRDKVSYDIKDNSFYIGEDKDRCVNDYNYDIFRKVVMEQNIIFEAKVVKNDILSKWMGMAKDARKKTKGNMSFEDMISTVKNYTGATYEELSKQSYYQIMTDFFRIGKLKEADVTTLFAAQAGTKKVKITNFAEGLELLKNPDDGLFKKANDVFGA